MKFIVVDGDREALAYTQQSLKHVYKNADIETFTDALNAYKYCVNHANELALMFLSVVLKPIDGLKLCELVCALPIPIGVVFTMRDESHELIELIHANGNGRYIVKPVTPTKIRTLTSTMVEDCWPDGAECKVCSRFWCGKWKDEADT